jgi:hypothetical protein
VAASAKASPASAESAPSSSPAAPAKAAPVPGIDRATAWTRNARHTETHAHAAAEGSAGAAELSEVTLASSATHSATAAATPSRARSEAASAPPGPAASWNTLAHATRIDLCAARHWADDEHLAYKHKQRRETGGVLV